MYDLLHKHKRMAQVILALISLPFAFFGVDYYFRGGDSAAGVVATYKGGRITQAEFTQALRDQQENLQRAQRPFDPAMFDNPDVRFQILQQLIRQRVIEKKGEDLHFRVTSAQVFDHIAADPRFQVGGKFSLDAYKAALEGARIPEASYEDSVRRQILAERFVDPIAGGSIVARPTREAFVTLLEQAREVAVATIDSEPLARDVKVDAAAVKAFYDANAALFKTPEEVSFEYLILTPDALAAEVTVTPDEVKAQYAATAKQYTQDEQRQAAHVLIAVKPDASASDKAAAKKKAEDVLAQAKANPAKFAELAKQYSQDPGSAAQGGDLGSNPRGTMVKAFDDAVFSAQTGDIVGPVETEFGYHVIKLNGITSSRSRAIDEVRPQIEADLRRQKVMQKFAAAADQFQNLVYEHADTLAGVAKALNLTVKTSGLVTRAKAQELAQGNAKFIEALWSPESLSSKRNTEAIEIGPNALMAGRVVEYKPAAPRPFDQVRDEIQRQLVAKQASEIAQARGREKLAALEQGRTDKAEGLAFGNPVTLRRNQMQPGFPPETVVRIFHADPARLPQYVGAPNERGGYSIYKILNAIAPAAPDPAKLAAAATRIGEMQSRELFDAYVAALRSGADIKINQANLEKK
jgi:peptidyl-prolyl cis-trans isomerase D